MTPVIFAPHSLPNRLIPLAEHRAFATYLIVQEQLEAGIVCLHPYDIFLGNHIAYQDSGFEISCCMHNAIARHPWNEKEFWRAYHKLGIEFMINLYSLLRISSSCYFCGLSTPLFYAGYLGIRCKLVTFEDHMEVADMKQIVSIAQKRPVTAADNGVCSRLNQLLHHNEWTSSDLLTFKSYCEVVLGKHALVSPKAMLAKLEYAYLLLSRSNS
ncbi:MULTISPECIES: hypothetical protein [Aphanothece]|uniref:hypothetical protein n=1 Tax=Aphanothece TaxID=1121 RepID=UPI003984E4A9